MALTIGSGITFGSGISLNPPIVPTTVLVDYLVVGGGGGGSDTSGGGGGAAISAGANSQSTGTVIFSNSNGISFGLNAGTLTASYTVPTVPRNLN